MTERLDELARRCEAAEGPDRELDARIWCALNGKRYAEHWVSGYDKGTQVGFTEPPKRTVIVTKRAVPNVTASIDSALTLVPEGWHSSIFTTEGAELRGSAAVRDRGGGPSFTSAAATPALALCAASLRARAANNG